MNRMLVLSPAHLKAVRQPRHRARSRLYTRVPPHRLAAYLCVPPRRYDAMTAPLLYGRR